MAPTELTDRPVQLRGSALARAVLRAAGWRIVFDGLPAAQGVVVLYPHTSNWDFVLGIMAKWAIGIPVTFWSKASLFRFPLFGRWLRWMGGVPVVRDAPQGATSQMAQAMRVAVAEQGFMWLALSPEGTRSMSKGWRTGFYQVAAQADVPVALAMFDFAQRRVGIDSCWRVSGDMHADLAVFAQRLAQYRGFAPHRAAPIRAIEK